jgi:lipoate-protein ligase B
MAYREALALQERLERARLAGEVPDTVIAVEHPPVITIGHRGDARNVVASADHLSRLGIEVVRTDRGGDVTYHGPGQCVLYPIVHLDRCRLTVAGFIEKLEECMIRAAADHGVTALRLPGCPGVFVGGDKLGAVGIHVSRGVTTHGLAFNADPDLSHFELIVPCGLRDHGVTSLRRAGGSPVDLEEIERRLIGHIAALLGREVKLVDVRADTVT